MSSDSAAGSPAQPEGPNMSIQVECDCGKVMRVKDDAVGKRVKCPDCHAMVKIPLPDESPDFEVVEDDDQPKPRLRKGTKPVKAAAVVVDDEDEEEEPRPKKVTKKRKRRAADGSDDWDPFWKTPTGMILNGLGLMGLGVGGIALYFLTDDRETGVIIAGVLCVCFGIGGIATGLTMKSKRARKKRRRDEEDEE
jgi:hypothetical protein